MRQHFYFGSLYFKRILFFQIVQNIVMKILAFIGTICFHFESHIRIDIITHDNIISIYSSQNQRNF